MEKQDTIAKLHREYIRKTISLDTAEKYEAFLEEFVPGESINSKSELLRREFQYAKMKGNKCAHPAMRSHAYEEFIRSQAILLGKGSTTFWINLSHFAIHSDTRGE